MVMVLLCFPMLCSYTWSFLVGWFDLVWLGRWQKLFWVKLMGIFFFWGNLLQCIYKTKSVQFIPQYVVPYVFYVAVTLMLLLAIIMNVACEVHIPVFRHSWSCLTCTCALSILWKDCSILSSTLDFSSKLLDIWYYPPHFWFWFSGQVCIWSTLLMVHLRNSLHKKYHCVEPTLQLSSAGAYICAGYRWYRCYL